MLPVEGLELPEPNFGLLLLVEPAFGLLLLLEPNFGLLPLVGLEDDGGLRLAEDEGREDEGRDEDGLLLRLLPRR